MARNKFGYDVEPTGFVRRDERGNIVSSFGFASGRGKRYSKAMGLPPEVSEDAYERAHRIRREGDARAQKILDEDLVRRAAKEEVAVKSDVIKSIQTGRPQGRFAPRVAGTAVVPDAETGEMIVVPVGEDRPGASMEDIRSMARKLGYYQDDPIKVAEAKKRASTKTVAMGPVYWNDTARAFVRDKTDGTLYKLPGQYNEDKIMNNMRYIMNAMKKPAYGEEVSDWEREWSQDEKDALDAQMEQQRIRVVWNVDQEPSEGWLFGIGSKEPIYSIKNMEVISNRELLGPNGEWTGGGDIQPSTYKSEEQAKKDLPQRVVPEYSEKDMANALGMAISQHGLSIQDYQGMGADDPTRKSIIRTAERILAAKERT